MNDTGDLNINIDLAKKYSLTLWTKNKHSDNPDYVTFLGRFPIEICLTLT